MENNGLKLKSVSRAKTEHLQTTGDTDPVRMKRYMETETVNLPTVQSFKYVGSTIDRGGGASKDVDNRVTKAWSKWRELSGVICDKKIPTKLKLLIYQTVSRPTLLYGWETWPMSVKYENRMATTEVSIFILFKLLLFLFNNNFIVYVIIVYCYLTVYACVNVKMAH